MDLKAYFDAHEQKQANASGKEVIKPSNPSKQYNAQYLTLLNKFVSLNVIDLINYTFMLNFLKKGSCTMANAYFAICDKIATNNNISIDIVNEFDQVVRYIFKHIYTFHKDRILDPTRIIEKIKLNCDYFDFTNDQSNAINKMCRFISDSNRKIFGLYGYAGTGKTTTITKFINILLYTKLIKSVVFAAPTNKAVNGIKAKFSHDLNTLVKDKHNNGSFNDTLDSLLDQGIQVDFITIHSLLNYRTDYSAEGERVFVKGKKSTINNYNLIIIDECSMIQLSMIINLFDEINKSTGIICKIILLGDPAQLPPVHESQSLIFATSEKQFDYGQFKKTLLDGQDGQDRQDRQDGQDGQDKPVIATVSVSMVEPDDHILTKFNTLKKNIMQIEHIILKDVVRTRNDGIVGISNEVRGYVLNEIKIPKFNKFIGLPGVFIYKYNKAIKKINTPWFTKCTQYFTNSLENVDISNIILAWTNFQTNEYNTTIRKLLYHTKSNINKFEVGDILILSDFYCVANQDGKFNASDQIKIIEAEYVVKAIPDFTENLCIKSKIKSLNDIKEKYIRTIKLINKNTTRKYNAWKIAAVKMADTINDDNKSTNNETQQQMYICDDSTIDAWNKDKEFIGSKIKELRNYYRTMHKESMNSIDSRVIRQFWKEYNNKLIDPFANVTYGASITVHKSQSSTYCNVFVDLHDIFKNQNSDEAKKCLYTAITRTSNELHILI